VTLRVKVEDDQTLFTVEDQGEGMSAEMIPKIFDLFEQGDQTRARERGGLGVGLTTVARLVEMHGGSIHAYSEGLGKGSTFHVRLPKGSPQARAHSRPEVAARPSTQARPRRVLVVEDNEDAGEMLRMVLEHWGHEVSVSRDGEAAFRAVDDLHPEIILLDIGLPTIDGFEVARRLRQRPDGDSLSIVALSGYGREIDKSRAREHGFDDYLTKPAPLADLQRILGGEVVRARPRSVSAPC
jgi:two-component system CheB/CheR fusion protein